MGYSSDDTQSGATTASRVRQLRLEQGWSQQELANRAGVSFSFVNQVEGGKNTVRLDALNRLLQVFGYAMLPARVSAQPSQQKQPSEISTDSGGESPSPPIRQKNDWACY